MRILLKSFLLSVCLAASGVASAQNISITELLTSPLDAEGNASRINASGVICGSIGTNAAYWSSTGISTILPLGGASRAHLTDINNSGDVVGYEAGGGIEQAILVSNGQKTYLAPHLTSDGWRTNALAINSSRMIVVRAAKNGAPVRSYIWQNGVLTQITFTNEPYATDINDAGLVVGFYYGVNWRGFLYSAITNSLVRDLNSGSSLPASWCQPYAINNTGQVAGFGFNPVRPIIWSVASSNPSHELPYPTGSDTTYAFDLNDAGEVAGQSLVSGVWRAVFWNASRQIQILPTLGAGDSFANGINDDGVIVGASRNSQGVSRPVRWSDAPVEVGFTTRDGDGSAIRPNVPYQILDNSGNVAASGTTNGTGTASVTLPLGNFTLVASLHGVFDPASPLCSSSSITVSASGVAGDLNLEIGTLEAYFTVGGRIYRGAGTISIGTVSKALNRSRAGNWFSDGGNAKSFSATVTINGQTRAIPGTLIAGRDHTVLSFDWNNGS